MTAAGTEQCVVRQKAADRSGTPEVKRADDSLPEAVKSVRRMAMKEKRQVGESCGNYSGQSRNTHSEGAGEELALLSES